MPALQRRISLRGPRFYEDGGKLMFVNHLDGSSCIGPRVATKDDKKDYAESFAAFQAGDVPTPMGPLVTFTTPEEAEA